MTRHARLGAQFSKKLTAGALVLLQKVVDGSPMERAVPYVRIVRGNRHDSPASRMLEKVIVRGPARDGGAVAPRDDRVGTCGFQRIRIIDRELSLGADRHGLACDGVRPVHQIVTGALQAS